MVNELSDRMRAIAAQEKKINHKLNLSKFLALRPQITQAIEDGWSVKFIWETLRGEEKIHVGYRMFLKLVKNRVNPSLVSSKEESSAKPAFAPAQTKPPVSQELKVPAKPPEPAEQAEQADVAEGFHYSSTYNIEDLI